MTWPQSTSRDRRLDVLRDLAAASSAADAATAVARTTLAVRAEGPTLVATAGDAEASPVLLLAEVPSARPTLDEASVSGPGSCAVAALAALACAGAAAADRVHVALVAVPRDPDDVSLRDLVGPERVAAAIVGDGAGPSALVTAWERGPSVDPANAVARSLARAIREAGLRPAACTTAPSRLAALAAELETPFAGFAPGERRREGAAGELVPLADYLRSVEILDSALRRLGPPGADALTADDEALVRERLERLGYLG